MQQSAWPNDDELEVIRIESLNDEIPRRVRSLRILHESLLEYLSPFLEFNENGSGRQNFSDAFSKAQLDALVLC